MMNARQSLTMRCALCVFVLAAATRTTWAQNDSEDASAALHVDSQMLTDNETTQNESNDQGTAPVEETGQPDLLSLVTGLPLGVLESPLRWGRLSFVSATVYQGYDSNPEPQNTPVGTMLTSLSALAVYSATFSGWGLNAQYQPFIWFSSKATFKDFSAASADLRTERRINGTWNWSFSDRFRYSPTHATTQSFGFVVDPNGGIGIGNAFLSSGRNLLVNGATFIVTNHQDEKSSLTFHANQDFVYLSSFVGDETGDTPSQQVASYSFGATWRDRISERNTLSLRCTYRAQNSFGDTSGDYNSLVAGIGLSRQLKPGMSISATLGPAWSFYSAGSDLQARTTLHGSVSFAKQFHRGAFIASFVRSDGFSGVISNAFNNRYDVGVTQQITTRWHFSSSASYLQQQAIGHSGTNGTLLSAQVNYFVSRNWSTFGQVRYLNVEGSQRFSAPEKTFIAGVRWAWVPEKP